MPAGRPIKRDPAHNVELRAIETLIPYARNSRTHSPEQVAQIAASITEWGWTTPVLIDEAGMIIAGHGRVQAARKLGLTDVPVVVATDWTDAKKRAYVIADNKLALNAGLPVAVYLFSESRGEGPAYCANSSLFKNFRPGCWHVPGRKDHAGEAGDGWRPAITAAARHRPTRSITTEIAHGKQAP